MSKYIGLLLLFIGSFVSASAYSPFVKNYKYAEYQGASQNWAIKQNSEKKIYVGNHYGLLEFDGYNWRMYSTKSLSPIRSIFIDSNDRVYVGLNEGFGYFETDEYGEMHYTSISDAVDKDLLVNRQIWSIASVEGTIYFQSFSGYFTYASNGDIDFISTVSQLYPLQNLGGKIYVPANNDIYHFDGESLSKHLSFDSHFRVKSMVQLSNPDEKIIFTEANGIWKSIGSKVSKWQTTIDEQLKQAVPNKALITADSLILVGTILDGVYALQLDGTLAWHINKQIGLQNNTVLDMMSDAENNVWVALDNGVSVIHNTNLLEVKSWYNKDIGAIYDIATLPNQTYIASNQGLFEIKNEKYNKDIFNTKLIPGTEGYILDLYKTSDNQLIMGHNYATYILDQQNSIRELAATGGGMCVQTFELNGEELLMQSSYTAINIFRKSPTTGQWVLRNKLKEFGYSVQFFEIVDNNIVWAALANKGLLKIQMDELYHEALAVTVYKGLEPDTESKIGVFKVKNRLVFTNEIQAYTYDDLHNKIVPYNLLNDHIGHFKKARRIVAVDRDTYWFITRRDAALISFAGTAPKIINTISFSDYDFVMLDDFENIVPLNSKESILCFNNGIAKIQHIGKDTLEYSELNLSLAWATAYSSRQATDSIPLVLDNQTAKRVPYEFNNLHFGVSLPRYDTKYTFRYKLKGLEGEVQLSTNASIEYSRLPYGKYSLVVEALDGRDEIVKALVYDFEIAPPFYASKWAYLVYIFLVLLAGSFIYQISKRRQLNKTKKLRLKQEKEIITLENDKLQSENTHKSKELATYAMNMIRQTEILTTLKTELEDQKKQLGAQYPNKYYQKLLGMIDDNLSSDYEWEVFQANFDRIHENFFRNLRKKYPELTSSDLKMCALLRLNLDTKEIANLMSITVRGVETRRYRMRRKLDLDTTQSLTEFLIDFKE